MAVRPIQPAPQSDYWIDNLPISGKGGKAIDTKMAIKPRSPNDDMVTGPQPEGTPTWMEHRRGGRVNKVAKRGRYDEGGGVNTYVSRDAPNVTPGGQRSSGLPPSGAFGDKPLDLTPPSKTAQATGKARGGQVKKVVKGYQHGGPVRSVVQGDTAPGAASASSHKWSANIAGRNVTMKNKGGKVNKVAKGRR